MQKLPFFALLLVLGLPLSTLAQKVVKTRPLAGYFLKTTVKDAEQKPYAWVFNDQEAFDAAFGAATTASSKPTAVDFERESIVALAAPRTRQNTQLMVRLVEQKAELRLEYKLKPESEAESFERRPLRLVAVPKASVSGKEIVVYDDKTEVQRINP